MLRRFWALSIVVLFITIFVIPSYAKVTVNVWQPWGGDLGKWMDQLGQEFEKTHPDIDIVMVFAPNDLETNQKFFAAVAAGTPPEVTFVDGPQVAEWAERGMLAPLDEFVKKSKVKSSDFFAPCWKQSYYKGHIWAMTYCADANFGFFWNKGVFKDAGLNPENPPMTIKQLDQYNEKITKFDDRGNLVRIGIIPWYAYGSANMMHTWGWVFGGDFFDYKANKFTLTNPKVVAALEWMVNSYAKKYDVAKIGGLMSGFGTAEQNPFIIGKMAMTPYGNWEIHNIETFAPKLEYGITTLPYPPGGEKSSSWVGGWTIAIPAGAKNQDAAWEFIKWVSDTAEGTSAVVRLQGFYPGYKNSPAFKEIAKDPRRAKFVEILQASRHQRPVTPVTSLYMGELSRAVDAAIYGQKTPLQALQDCQNTVQKELDKILKK